MSLNLFHRLDRYDRRIRQLERTEGEDGGGGGDHPDSDHTTFAALEHDTAHDDRFSLLAHTHAAHADSDHDDRFALIEHDSAHSDAFAALAAAVPVGGSTGQVLTKTSATNYATAWQTGAAHADSDHDDRFVQLPGTWQTPAYFTGWAGTTTSGTRNLRFRLENDVVRLDGACARGSGSLLTIFTLPSGFRPDALRIFWISGGGVTQTRVNIAADGIVTQSAGATDFTRVSFDGITFPIT